MAVTDKPSCVYRIYSRRDGGLLYVGCTINLKNRMQQHGAYSYPPKKVEVVATPFYERDVALRIEGYLIAHLRPIDNVVGLDRRAAHTFSYWHEGSMTDWPGTNPAGEILITRQRELNDLLVGRIEEMMRHLEVDPATWDRKAS